MTLEKREITRDGRRDIYALPGTGKKIVMERSGCYILSEEGKVISRSYDKIHDFKNGLAVFDKGKKKGIITEQGQELFGRLLDNVYFDGEIIRVCTGVSWGFANCQGEFLCPVQYKFIEKFNNGYARFENHEGKWGIINNQGHIVVEPMYRFLGPLGGEKIIAQNALGFGCIDMNNKWVVPFRYVHIQTTDDVTILFNNSEDRVVV